MQMVVIHKLLALSDSYNVDVLLACISHSHSADACSHPTHRCESPCISHAGMVHYSQCVNIYNYSWEDDPPPCQPVGMRKEPSREGNTSEVGLRSVVLPKFRDPLALKVDCGRFCFGGQGKNVEDCPVKLFNIELTTFRLSLFNTAVLHVAQQPTIRN